MHYAYKVIQRRKIKLVLLMNHGAPHGLFILINFIFYIFYISKPTQHDKDKPRFSIKKLNLF